VNVDFDKRFLQKAFNRYGITGWDSVFSHRVLDLSGVLMCLIEIGKLPKDLLTAKGHTLEKVLNALKIPYNASDLHSAKGDTILTARALYRLLELIKG
jgi:DNA polymerase III epsilon subunit-like protein